MTILRSSLLRGILGRIQQYAFLNRATGPYWWAYWAMMTCNVFSPQFMWFEIKNKHYVLFIISIVVNIGMWFERFVIM